jgi:hypothetical protein
MMTCVGYKILEETATSTTTLPIILLASPNFQDCWARGSIVLSTINFLAEIFERQRVFRQMQVPLSPFKKCAQTNTQNSHQVNRSRYLLPEVNHFEE